jgi:type II secretory pathway component HofQ
MSRGRILSLAAAGILAVLGLIFFLPQMFSPIPGLAAELKLCLEPADATEYHENRNVDPSRLIQVELLFAGFDTTMAGTSLASETADHYRPVSGLVRDDARLQAALNRLREERCIRILAEPRLGTTSGCAFQVASGGEMPVVSAEDGVTIEYKPFGTTIAGLATLRMDGRLHLQLDVTLSDPVQQSGAPPGQPEFDVVKANVSLVVGDGQTCFVVGPKRKRKVQTETRVPLLSDAPGIGSSFVFPREIEIEEQLLILATPKLVTAF